MTETSTFEVADSYLQDARAALSRLDRCGPFTLEEQLHLCTEITEVVRWVTLMRDEWWDTLGHAMNAKRCEIGGVVYERSKPRVSVSKFERERFLRDLNDAKNIVTGEIENPYDRLLRVARIDAHAVRTTVLKEYGLNMSDYTQIEWSRRYKVRAVPGRVEGAA